MDHKRGLSDTDLRNNVGFSVHYKYQSSFLGQSSLATGLVPAINTFDAKSAIRWRRQARIVPHYRLNLAARTSSIDLTLPSRPGRV
ncbi:hypothetical protein [Spirosoma humi]